MDLSTRRDVIKGGVFTAAAAGSCRLFAAAVPAGEAVTAEEKEILGRWQKQTDEVSPEAYRAYLRDGDTRSLRSLENVEAAFGKVMREAADTVVEGDAPAVWSVYNMGYVVKTRKSLFSIDLVHRKAASIAPLLDFSLVTHNHADHCSMELYNAMNGSRKTVISNFLDNYGARNWRRNGGYTRAEKVFKIKDVEIRTSLIDHNDYLVDFTTAFEIRTGDFVLYHTGDSGLGTEPKLGTSRSRPDLWLFFPGCGINTEKAVEKVGAKRIVFGHLWELAHGSSRLNAPLIRNALAAARRHCGDVSFALWGERIC